MEEKLPFLNSDQMGWSSVIFVDQTEGEIELELVASTFTKCLRVGLPLQPHLVPSPTHHVKDRIFLFLSKLIIACIRVRRLADGRRSSLAHNFLFNRWLGFDHGHLRNSLESSFLRMMNDTRSHFQGLMLVVIILLIIFRYSGAFLDNFIFLIIFKKKNFEKN